MKDTIETDFYTEQKTRGEQLKELLEPLLEFTPRERFVFMEYHYFDTHMRHVAACLNVPLGRAYEILDRAEDKIAKRNTDEAEEVSDSPVTGITKNLRAMRSLVKSQKRKDSTKC